MIKKPTVFQFHYRLYAVFSTKKHTQFVLLISNCIICFSPLISASTLQLTELQSWFVLWPSLAVYRLEISNEARVSVFVWRTSVPQRNIIQGQRNKSYQLAVIMYCSSESKSSLVTGNVHFGAHNVFVLLVVGFVSIKWKNHNTFNKHKLAFFVILLLLTVYMIIHIKYVKPALIGRLTAPDCGGLQFWSL